MTCAEFKDKVTNDPGEALPSERVAVARHYIECQKCAAFFSLLMMAIESRLTPEEKMMCDERGRKLGQEAIDAYCADREI